MRGHERKGKRSGGVRIEAVFPPVADACRAFEPADLPKIEKISEARRLGGSEARRLDRDVTDMTTTRISST